MVPRNSALGCEARKGAACTLAVHGVLLSVQSRASWLFFQGITFHRAEPSRAMETPEYQLFCCCCCIISVSYRLSSSSLLGDSDRASNSSHCDGQPRALLLCFRGFACVYRVSYRPIVGNRNEHAVQLIIACCAGAGRDKPTLPPAFKGIRTATEHCTTIAAVQ